MKENGVLALAVCAAALMGSAGCSEDKAKYTIGGTVVGLIADGLVLTTSGEPGLSLAAGQTTFTFANKVASGTPYAVTVAAQPTARTCLVTQGTGVVAEADVTNVVVTCAGGGAWSPAGSLAVPRGAFTTTVLSSGKVLVAGGIIDSTNEAATATAELFDPSTRTWTTVAPMAKPRKWACSTLLASGEVLVVGGYNLNDGDLATAEVYDPVGNTWSQTAGPMAVKRTAPACTGLASGEVLVSGGQNTVVERTSERYDPNTGLFTQTGSMATGRSFHSATTLLTGQVLVVGGCNAPFAPSPCDTTTASAERYDPATSPATGIWSSAGALPSSFGVAGHTATLLPNGNVLVAGGCHVGSGRCLDTADQRHVSVFDGAGWTDKGPLAHGRVLAAALLLSTGDVLVAAGDKEYPSAWRRSTERYSTSSGTLGAGPSMVNYHGERVGAAKLADGTWLVIGGLVQGGTMALHTGAADIFTE